MASHNIRSSLTLSSMADDTNSVLARGVPRTLMPSMLRTSGRDLRCPLDTGRLRSTCVSFLGAIWCHHRGGAALFLARTPDRHRQGKRTDAHPPPATLPLPKRLGCRRSSKQGRPNGRQIDAWPSAQCVAVSSMQGAVCSLQGAVLPSARRTPTGLGRPTAKSSGISTTQPCVVEACVVLVRVT